MSPSASAAPGHIFPGRSDAPGLTIAGSWSRSQLVSVSVLGRKDYSFVNMYRRYLAELIGTAVLVIAGVGTAVLAPKSGPIAVALAFGFTLMVLAYGLGPISGCHINPAVTVGVLIAGKISLRDAVSYIVCQCVGALFGAGVVYSVARQRPGYSVSRDGLGTNGWGSHSASGYSLAAAAIIEVTLSALLVYTVLAVTHAANTATVAGIPIGIALVVCHLIAIPIDGTSVNPARSFGPALISGGPALSQLWLFFVAPLLGAIVAATLHRTLSLSPELPRRPSYHQDSAAAPAITHN